MIQYHIKLQQPRRITLTHRFPIFSRLCEDCSRPDLWNRNHPERSCSSPRCVPSFGQHSRRKERRPGIAFNQTPQTSLQGVRISSVTVSSRGEGGDRHEDKDGLSLEATSRSCRSSRHPLNQSPRHTSCQQSWTRTAMNVASYLLDLIKANADNIPEKTTDPELAEPNFLAQSNVKANLLCY
jgi:hypothetical protein